MKRLMLLVIFLGIFVIGFVLFKVLSKETGSISINSYPQKASVYINGELKGETPLTVNSLPFGTYEILVRLEGYREYKEEVKLSSSNPNALVNPILEHAVFTLSVDSSPTNSDVYVDGVLKGKTPIVIADLIANQSHLIEVKHENYRDWKQTISVKANDSLNLFAQLEPITTELIVSSVPDKATVFLNKSEVGKTPLDLKDIPEGKYTLTVSLLQYETYTEDIEIKKGVIVKRDVVLRKTKYYISILSNPSGAKVLIDGIEVGTTPYNTSSITEGKHKIHVELDGYLPYETEVIVVQNQPTVISINLLKLP
ncbi:PEGA domain-containing protein [Caldisericum exile]|uniref:PEGA domain-containing protein n=1 Tax=Caldisericum exile (strain DSM 21853 / NBRC 104410 / AZM16c01) TaxID=511051 RepID=A0A7U6JGV2_CALEA|nr:PEGA domain-containing protein [Caldisericum exile]BAL80887.1 hypothetical protein CSE_07610 [Caldisericum exile AZM16c01]